jgi:hypothetical protein
MSRIFVNTFSADVESLIIQQKSNARIQPTGEQPTKPSILQMRAMLFPVGCNESLDFVRPHHSAFPEPSPTILSLNSPAAAWRFI